MIFVELEAVMAHKFINQIEPGQVVEDVYLVKEPILRSTTRGDLYIAMYLCDKTGQVNCRMWQASEAIYSSLPRPGFVFVQGKSELYQNTLQVVANSVRVADASKLNLDDYVPRTPKDITVMFNEVEDMLAAIKNAQVKALVNEFLGDTKLMEKFRKSPAAVKMHHDYIGGLLEHTHNMLRVASAILPLYPHLQADLVLAGVFLHDMGKTEELAYDTAFSYTDSGQLIGHIVKGVMMIQAKAEALRAKGQPVDASVIDALDHLVLAHHGTYEFGSPKLPATAEAFVVNYVDNLDAKVNQVTTAIDSDASESNWTGWQNSLQTKLYRKRIG
jgi:3'-5' exoribonuclease